MSILLELMNIIFDCDTLLEYLCGLKDRVQQAVMVQKPQNLNIAMF